MFGVRLFLANCCFFALAVAPAQADPLPECPNVFSDAGTADCQFTSKDRAGLRFEKRIADKTAEIRVIAPDGSTAQTLSEHTKGPFASGVLLVRDLDGDGRDDLLLSLTTPSSHSNVSWALWRASGGTTQFTRIKPPAVKVSPFVEPFGAAFWHAGDDLFAAWGDGPTRSWLTRIFRIENDQLVPILAVQNDGFSPNGSTGPCFLEEQYDLARYHLTPDTARDRFCASTHEHMPGSL
ncbi:hypothetical protein [Segniliparus rugosus]|uniref:FG-GAP repeat protein n=1 Tax=Segniliparus rugosus (strain ATCC BAA-974 / DSM 45345 / CCUG 50838 / CIP 108380 / JCM 13579 / CDC 945) TaxID=679197 RepID=E5XSL7_SEGRC|nr:hypothetical protein [Segniliparus rugosus]EFV12694.1 hypothetical protein HMPREF9336_02489 [Segniliparus rugosus ATCC BAA-974]